MGICPRLSLMRCRSSKSRPALQRPQPAANPRVRSASLQNPVRMIFMAMCLNLSGNEFSTRGIPSRCDEIPSSVTSPAGPLAGRSSKTNCFSSRGIRERSWLTLTYTKSLAFLGRESLLVFDYHRHRYKTGEGELLDPSVLRFQRRYFRRVQVAFRIDGQVVQGAELSLS